MTQIWTNHLMTAEDEDREYQFLRPDYIQMIDEALTSLGDFGEVRLVVEKGRLRFLVTQRSFDMLKWRPGTLVKKIEP
jgi:hypothetical protein